MYYLIYKVINKNSGKIYIGKHKTKNINDGYMGSGTEIQFAISIEGKSNFEKEILFVFENEADMIAKEKELVTKEFILTENTYNKAVAGGATWSGLRGPKDEVFYKSIKDRPKCPKCKKNPRAINYYRKNKIHYRPTCPKCEREEKYKNSLSNQLLIKSGYIKKKNCDRCNFIGKHQSQLKIVYLDGNKLNTSRSNLRTYCLNCLAEISNLNQKSDLIPDY